MISATTTNKKKSCKTGSGFQQHCLDKKKQQRVDTCLSRLVHRAASCQHVSLMPLGSRSQRESKLFHRVGSTPACGRKLGVDTTTTREVSRWTSDSKPTRGLSSTDSQRATFKKNFLMPVWTGLGIGDWGGGGGGLWLMFDVRGKKLPGQSERVQSSRLTLSHRAL